MSVRSMTLLSVTLRSILALAAGCGALPVAAADLPPRKPGLWQISTTFAEFEKAGLPPMIAEHCIDAATDQLMDAAGGGVRPDSCWKREVQRAGNSIVVDSRCKMGRSTLHMHAVISGDLNSAYSVKVTTRQEGELTPGIPANETSTITAKWLGACRADLKPGDMVTFGKKTNIREMQNAPAAPPPRR